MPDATSLPPPPSPTGTAPDWPEGLIPVGYVLDAWGTRGWLKVAPDSGSPEALLKAPHWWLLPPPTRGSRPGRCLARRQARTHGQSVVATLDTIDDRDQAEALRGWTVLLRREDFPPVRDQEYYWVDLIGCTVRNREGVDLGVVIGLLDSGAQSVLRLRRPDHDTVPGAGERLIPFVDAYVLDVDLAARVITADWQPDYD